MSKALIGYTGFVGSTLIKQTQFDSCFRSTNIMEINNQSFEIVVCAGAPAQKWVANSDPKYDQQRIESLISHLSTIKCQKFILISTVDVFKEPIEIDELTSVSEVGLHPYGLHRRRLEQFVEENFQDSLIIRLPGLVGPGLKKNALFDFQNNNNIHLIDKRAVFQFYPMVNLWFDIQKALQCNLNLVHLTSEPISISEIAQHGFGINFDNELISNPARYDMKSIHSLLFSNNKTYQYTKRETIQAVRAYAQSEEKR
jgi:nucleoside-diphosphate-sugar epimerase